MSLRDRRIGTKVDDRELMDRVDHLEIWRTPSGRFSIVNTDSDETVKQNVMTLDDARDWAYIISNQEAMQDVPQITSASRQADKMRSFQQDKLGHYVEYFNKPNPVERLSSLGSYESRQRVARDYEGYSGEY